MVAITGPAPNPQRARRNNDSYGGFRVIRDDGVVRGPELPALTPQGMPWNPKTILWWDMWRRSPLGQLLRDVDWATLEKGALIYDTIWSTQQWAKITDIANLSRELDRITGNYGATYADRLKLRILVEDEDPAEVVAAVKSMKDSHYEDLFADED